VLNAAMLYWPMPNTLYVEGYALDRFAEGAWALQPVHQNKVSGPLDWFWRSIVLVSHAHNMFDAIYLTNPRIVTGFA
jgi:hypothetical protein